MFCKLTKLSATVLSPGFDPQKRPKVGGGGSYTYFCISGGEFKLKKELEEEKIHLVFKIGRNKANFAEAAINVC
jgi:hypothetical protein